MAHIPQILRAIGMDRILTEYYSWRSQSDKNILVTLITVKPVKENAWTDTVSSFVSLQDLLG